MTIHVVIRDARNLVATLGVVAALGLVLAAPANAIVEGRNCEPEPTDEKIEYGDLVKCNIDESNDSDFFRFDGFTDEIIRVQTTRLSGDGVQCFQLLAQGVPLDVVRCGDFNRTRDYKLAGMGEYTIRMTEQSNNQMVRYAVALERIAPPSPAALPIDYDNAAPKSDKIASKGDVDIWFFNGTAPDTINVATSRLSESGVQCYRVYAPDGTPLDVERCGDFNPTRDYKLAQSGIHTIVMTEQSNDQRVRYSLALACVDGVCEPPDPPPPDVSGCVTLRGAPLVDRRVRLTQANEAGQEDRTDVRGCYEFQTVVEERSFRVRIFGPVVPVVPPPE